MFGKKKVETGYMVKGYRTDMFYLSPINVSKTKIMCMPRVFRSLKEAENALESIKGTGEKLEIIEVLIK
jgi:hypothetical protein|nr:MAG TPA: hypothetical protein [Caudoviricetes sp.]